MAGHRPGKWPVNIERTWLILAKRRTVFYCLAFRFRVKVTQWLRVLFTKRRIHDGMDNASARGNLLEL
jgi:hypothetical protein